ncbi:hypothetical protein [Alloalcanivorax marinus]|uniref:hypothetical protein n=1 Tax=Alloalcanivorax marinus TaxID=1177169 RepID=UPI001932C622|nr:hypothetical protein [Alloalcanivorax marinus]MBL7250214.1 hypothetical protein [Alloalcanivorax marinus]
MRKKILLPSLLGVAASFLSSLSAANWDTGACPQPHVGPAPCIETEINGNIYHFNGNGGHVDGWHGRPEAEGGGEFDFLGTDLDLECDVVTYGCNLTLSGEVKKCQDSTGAWRIGVKMSRADLSPGQFVCNFITMSGFPWYSKDSTITAHCPFEDNCDSFIPYDPNASTYIGNLGDISVDVSLVGNLVNAEHLHGVVFTPGIGANFSFSSPLYNCDEEEQDCSIDGVLTIDNATSLEIY